MQVVELLILAAVVAVVMFQLYSVLGRRMGRQPEDNVKPGAAMRPLRERMLARAEPPPPAAIPGVAGLKARDPAFDVARFLAGARSAYEQIVQAYAKGDRDALKRLTSSTVYKVFDGALASREAAQRTEQVEFLQPTRADLDDASIAGDTRPRSGYGSCRNCAAAPRTRPARRWTTAARRSSGPSSACSPAAIPTGPWRASRPLRPDRRADPTPPCRLASRLGRGLFAPP